MHRIHRVVWGFSPKFDNHGTYDTCTRVPALELQLATRRMNPYSFLKRAVYMPLTIIGCDFRSCGSLELFTLNPPDRLASSLLGANHDVNAAHQPLHPPQPFPLHNCSLHCTMTVNVPQNVKHDSAIASELTSGIEILTASEDVIQTAPLRAVFGSTICILTLARVSLLAVSSLLHLFTIHPDRTGWWKTIHFWS